MGFWERLTRRAAAPVPVARSASPVAQGFTALDWTEFPYWEDQASGLMGRLPRAYALSVPAVSRARNIICGTIAGLPMEVLDANDTEVRSPLLEQIDPLVPNPVTLAQTLEDVIFEGLGWWKILERDFYGYPTKARRYDPQVVTTQPPPGTIVDTLPSGIFVPGSTLWVAGVPTPATDMIRFDSPNPPILVTGAVAIRRAAKLIAAAEMYADSPQARGYFTPADNVDPSDEDVAATLAAWKTARQQGVDGYVPAALVWNQVQVPTPVDLGLASLIEKSNVEIANLFGLDAEDLNVSTTTRTYRNAVDKRQDKINQTFAPIVAAIAARLSMGDITRRGQRVCFDWDRYLEPNPTDRATIASAYITAGVFTPDEVRADEGKPPLSAAQKRELAPPAPPATPVVPGPTQQESNVVPINAHAHRAIGFSGDPGLVFDVDVAASFSVDEARRTITGLVVPWGEVGRTGGRKWRFAPDSLKFNRAHANRIKLLVDHDNSQSVGHLVRTWSDDQGQWATFKVARGPAGDAALAMAADGARDGLSVGIGYEGSDAGFTYTDDPTDQSVRYVTAAPWRETSLVALPAFDSARATAVTMSADHTGVEVPDTATEPQAQTAAPGAAVTFTAEQFNALMSRLTPQEPERAAVINPLASPLATPVPAVQVNEAPLYRFDGKPGQRGLIADIKSNAFEDREVRGKAEKFMADAMEAAFANVTVSNVTTLNPIIPRPDLWVPNLYFTRPIGSMVTGGAVSEITQQKLPKFNSSSGMVQSHSEGVEPTEGAYTTTSQTVSPAAIDGLMKINREVIDQGGTPQADQLIWHEMTEFYAKLLETRLVDALQALSLSDTPIVGSDTDLQSALTTYFAGLQFLAGGDRYSGLALNSDLYTAIATAVDADGRPLFPMNSPVNANGSVATDLTQVRVGSKLGVPAWALASGNGGPDKSYLFVPGSVYQWFSPPQRINLYQVAVSYVGIGLFGYSAEFVTRNSDVVQLAWTAS